MGRAAQKAAKQLDDEIAEILSRTRGHAAVQRSGSKPKLYVEGIGHRLPRGYEIHWNWTARQGDKKIDSGALTGGNLPEFYESWPDRREQASIVAEMKSIMRSWISSGEFGPRDLSPTIDVTLRKSGSEMPIRGSRSHATKTQGMKTPDPGKAYNAHRLEEEFGGVWHSGADAHGYQDHWMETPDGTVWRPRVPHQYYSQAVGKLMMVVSRRVLPKPEARWR